MGGVHSRCCYRHFDDFPGIGADAIAALVGEAGCERAMEDLAQSHPLAFWALATRFGPEVNRTTALRLLAGGERLRLVSEAMGIPFCLRKIPAQACPETLPFVTWSTQASRRMANFIPEDQDAKAAWLRMTYFGARACDEDFGLWAGRNLTGRTARELPCEAIMPVALYAWHSRQKQNPLHCLADKPWRRDMNFNNAILQTSRWLHRLSLRSYFETAPDHHQTFDFVPLRTFSCVLEEAKIMKNCLDCYGPKLAAGNTRLFGVRRSGRRIATVELNRDENDVWAVCQLKGPENSEVSTEVHKAVLSWAASCSDTHGSEVAYASPRLMNTRLMELLRPYCEDRQKHEIWLRPMRLRGLKLALGGLAGTHGIHSWLLNC